MPIVAKLIELRTHDPTAVLRMAMIEKYADGSGIHCSLTVQAGRFTCEDFGFHFDEFHLSAAIKKLRSMDSGREDVAVLAQLYESDLIRFSLDHWGHVFVSGELGHHSLPLNMLQFSFRTDQTVLRPLIADLEAVLKSKG